MIPKEVVATPILRRCKSTDSLAAPAIHATAAIAPGGAFPKHFHPSRAMANRTPNDLKTIGLKATLPRLKILNLFETSAERHLTAEDVYKILLGEGMDIGLATIYRVLTQFEQAGLLSRHHFESGKAVFELNEGGHHDHLVCLQCGHVEEFFDSEIERRQDAIARERGFAIHEHSLQLYAYCNRPNCPNRKGAGVRGAIEPPSGEG
jgi:Fur family ferric uptake transcriptional regulator